MFKKEVYSERRSKLKKEISKGIALFVANHEASMNYPDNTYHYHQDSNFSYFFGLDLPNYAGVIDFESGEEILFGNEVTIDDVIWMGPQPSLTEQAEKIGVQKTKELSSLAGYLQEVMKLGRKIHFLPPYRGEMKIELSGLLHLPVGALKQNSSMELIRAIVKLREIKDALEISEIEKAVATAYLMHTTAMKMAKPGVVEQEIAGIIEGIAIACGGQVSFPVILSIDGQTLHNHLHRNVLKEGRMMVVDAGAETENYYDSDITRTIPVGGKFNQRQKEIYEIVLAANMNVIKNVGPNMEYRKMHTLACRTIIEGLKAVGLMKGNVDDALAAGAHYLFMPHGLGHQMGMDVHEMEGLGEDNVGYDEITIRSKQMGFSGLRMGKTLKPGHVITDEPGIYFVPKLIDVFRSEGKFNEFVNYDKVETYKDFGGIRIEDDLLITENGSRVLGKPIPKTVAEVEETCAQSCDWMKMKDFL